MDMMLAGIAKDRCPRRKHTVRGGSTEMNEYLNKEGRSKKRKRKGREKRRERRKKEFKQGWRRVREKSETR